MTTLNDYRKEAIPAGDRPDADALIREAWRLRRRRYLVIGVVFFFVVGGIAAGLALSQGGGRGNTGAGHNQTAPAAPKVAPVAPPQKSPGTALPNSALFTQISSTPTGLLLSGETAATAQSPHPTCVAAPLYPQSLAVGKPEIGSCGNPLLFGQSVAAATNQDPQSNNVTVSVNVANPATGVVSDGPVVMTYQYSSDTHLVTAYGTEWLWIYDVATTNGPELLQVSTQSGAVVDTVAMPALYRPILAADDGGVWVANSVGGSSAPALLYVSAGSRSPAVVIADPDDPICWLVADGTNAWIGAGLSACAKQSVEKFVDHGQAPVFSTPSPYLSFTVIGNEANGLWTMEATPGPRNLVYINPDTGLESIVGTLPYAQEPLNVADEGVAEGQVVYFQGALYLLEPPFRLDGFQGYSSVVRVVPSRRN
jgi:hypothetical protein